MPSSTTESSSVEETVTTGRSVTSGWGRLFSSNRIIWIIAAVAVVSLLAGMLLSRFIIAPGELASSATAPDSGLITVPIEQRELANDVVVRGDANYADSVEVKVETGSLDGPAVVTGQVPEVGATLAAAAVALEVAGRPVIVLPGELPVYRTLRVGVSGPDVIQLKQALQSVGINAGNVSSNVFDSATSAGVAALYALVGYTPPASPEGTKEALQGASEGVVSAQQSLAQAQAALRSASGGPSPTVVLEQQNLVRAAQRVVDRACNPTPTSPDEQNECDAANDDLALALARQAEAIAPAGTASEQAAVSAAVQQLASARSTLAEAKEGTLTYLPSSEVLYLEGLPRRVDEVMVERGSIATSAVMRVSGASLLITASASAADAALLEVGTKATMTLSDDSEITATITLLEPKESTGGDADSGSRYTLELTPDDLTDEQLALLRGTNVRVSIPVSSTDGEVLAVPLAALTAGAGGESRIEVTTGDGEETELIEVTTGLAAGGYVEISAVDGTIAEGDLVVVGR